jgi:hypothetical protein
MRQTIILRPANKTEAAGTHIKILEQARKRGEKHKHTRERVLCVCHEVGVVCVRVCECSGSQHPGNRCI